MTSLVLDMSGEEDENGFYRTAIIPLKKCFCPSAARSRKDLKGPRKGHSGTRLEKVNLKESRRRPVMRFVVGLCAQVR